MFDLNGMTALVTGANTGIGQGIAIALAQAGADIVAVGRSSANDTEREVQAAGRAFHSIYADLERSHEAQRVVAQAPEVTCRAEARDRDAGRDIGPAFPVARLRRRLGRARRLRMRRVCGLARRFEGDDDSVRRGFLLARDVLRPFVR